jgi:hypothetical protein
VLTKNAFTELGVAMLSSVLNSNSMPQKKSGSLAQFPVPVELIERRIYLIRSQKIMLDSDLAEPLPSRDSYAGAGGQAKPRSFSRRLHVPAHKGRSRLLEMALMDNAADCLVDPIA